MASEIMKYIIVIIAIIGVFSIFASFYGDASAANGKNYNEQYPSLGKLNNYSSYLNNQSEQLRNTALASTSANTNQIPGYQLVTFLTQGVGIAATGFFGLIDVGISLFADASNYLGIPGIIFGLVIVYLFFKMGASIINAIRGWPL